MTIFDWAKTFDWLGVLLQSYAVAGALIAIGTSACRLHKMHPRSSTKWSWLFLYTGLFAMGWYALALLLSGMASTFEQAACALAGGYVLATIDSWRKVPAVALKNKAELE